jgi:hypothetical protein
MAWLEEIIKGDRTGPINVFWWDAVRLNLSTGSSLTYGPARPWVFKVRSNDGKITVDYILYIDDSRSTGPTSDECRQAQRKLSATGKHFEIQDVARKQRPP